MQTLNVGAGLSEAEYKAADDQRRADLLAESRTDANFFFWAAGFAALGTGLLPIRFGLLVNVGIVDLLRVYGGSLGALYGLTLLASATLFVGLLILMGFAGRQGYRWAFVIGIALYGADSLALMLTLSMWSLGVHAFFMFKWFEGFKALRELSQ
jgi:hypothetical protein